MQAMVEAIDVSLIMQAMVEAIVNVSLIMQAIVEAIVNVSLIMQAIVEAIVIKLYMWSEELSQTHHILSLLVGGVQLKLMTLCHFQVVLVLRQVYHIVCSVVSHISTDIRIQ